MPSSEPLPIRHDDDVVRVRQEVRRLSQELGLSLVDLTKLITAASELARNTLIHGGGGEMRVEYVEDTDRRGLRLSFCDQGPGIPNVEQAMRDGFTSGSGLGLGLGGARRLVNDFALESTPGRGTRVTITKWR